MSLSFGGKKLFENVNVKFTPGNCWPDRSQWSWKIHLYENSFQADWTQYGRSPNGFQTSPICLETRSLCLWWRARSKTVMMGNERLFQIMEEKINSMKSLIFPKPMECVPRNWNAFAELNGWEAESRSRHHVGRTGHRWIHAPKYKMKELVPADKVKVLLAQALFGQPGCPFYWMSPRIITWISMPFSGWKTFFEFSKYRDCDFPWSSLLNKVCMHIADVDFPKSQLTQATMIFGVKLEIWICVFISTK